MTTMRIVTLSLLLLVWCVAGCGDAGSSATAERQYDVFGDGKVDNSRVVARVNGERITERMLDMRYEELVGEEKARFAGADGRRLLVRKMVEEMLRVRDAEENNLHLEPVVARVLNAHYRQAMSLAQQNRLAEGVEPTVDQVREYFEQHRDDYVRLGTMQASHIACSTRAQAQEAYEEVTRRNRAFATVAREFSKNPTTAANGGDLGWFNKGGFVPGVRNSKEFTEAIWDLEMGVNPPLQVGDRWHVVKVHDRQPGRRQTLDEAYDRVVADLKPTLQRAKADAWLDTARAEAEIEYFGEFRPGHGKTAKELLERAYYAADPQQKADLLKLLIEDYPDDEYTDDAMFMAGNLYLDRWGDRRRASFYLTALVRKFPDSEYATDAQYILDNMDNPKFTKPTSIEDLRPE